MQKVKTYKSIPLDSNTWGNFGFDDEYFLNTAVLDLQLCDIDFVIPGMNKTDRVRLQEAEENALVLTLTSLYPSSFFISCQ